MKEEVGTDFKKQRREPLLLSPMQLRDGNMKLEEADDQVLRYGESRVYDL